MTDSPTPTNLDDNELKVGLDALLGDILLVDLDTVAQIFALPSRKAVRDRIDRGTLPLRTVQVGAVNSPLLVQVSAIYALLGLQWTPPASVINSSPSNGRSRPAPKKKDARCTGRPSDSLEGSTNYEEA